MYALIAISASVSCRSGTPRTPTPPSTELEVVLADLELVRGEPLALSLSFGGAPSTAPETITV